MATINELTYSVREGIKEYSDDTEIDSRYILFLYNTKRSKYLRQDLNNYGKSVDNSIQQTFCVSLEKVSSNECDSDFGCSKILRSTKKLPRPIELHTKVAINKVKPIVRTSVPFNFVSKERIPYIGGSSFSRGIYSFIDPDGYLYVTSNSDISLLDCISVTGVFEDPLKLEEFGTCCNCNDNTVCFDPNISEYPLQSHYIDLIKNEIINELLITKSVREDKENDATDS